MLACYHHSLKRFIHLPLLIVHQKHTNWKRVPHPLINYLKNYHNSFLILFVCKLMFSLFSSSYKNKINSKKISIFNVFRSHFNIKMKWNKMKMVFYFICSHNMIKDIFWHLSKKKNFINFLKQTVQYITLFLMIQQFYFF